MFRSHSNGQTLLMCSRMGGISVCLYRSRMDTIMFFCEKVFDRAGARKDKFDLLNSFLGGRRKLEQCGVHHPLTYSKSKRRVFAAVRYAPSTFLLEEQWGVHLPFLFHPCLIRVFYSEDESSSNMARTNHSLIQGTIGCTSPFPFFQPILFAKIFWKETWC